MSNFNNDLRQGFRKNGIAKVKEIMKQNPNKTYQLIRYDEDYDPNGENVDKYLEKGWSIEVDDQPIVDSRSNSPDNKNEQSLRKSPLTCKGKGKAQFVCVSIDSEQLAEQEKVKARRNLERYIASSRGRTAVKKGAELHLTDSEVNESNMNNNSEV